MLFILFSNQALVAVFLGIDNMKKIVLNVNKISLIISFISITISLVTICISIKINNQVSLYLQNKVFKQAKLTNNSDAVIIYDIPDTTVIRRDGSTVEVKSHKANDKLNGVIIENETSNNSATNNKQQPENKTSVISEKSNSNNIHQKQSTQEEINTNIYKQTTSKQNGVISGKYVIQAGSFKNKQQAQKQCEKIKKSINAQDKQCQCVFKNNQYRVIIFPFEDTDSADKFSKILSKKKIPVLVKKNI